MGAGSETCLLSPMQTRQPSPLALQPACQRLPLGRVSLAERSTGGWGEMPPLKKERPPKRGLSSRSAATTKGAPAKLIPVMRTATLKGAAALLSGTEKAAAWRQEEGRRERKLTVVFLFSRLAVPVTLLSDALVTEMGV